MQRSKIVARPEKAGGWDVVLEGWGGWMGQEGGGWLVGSGGAVGGGGWRSWWGWSVLGWRHDARFQCIFLQKAGQHSSRTRHSIISDTFGWGLKHSSLIGWCYSTCECHSVVSDIIVFSLRRTSITKAVRRLDSRLNFTCRTKVPMHV